MTTVEESSVFSSVACYRTFMFVCRKMSVSKTGGCKRGMEMPVFVEFSDMARIWKLI